MKDKENKKNVGGKPLKFKTPEALKRKVKDYFEKCDNEQVTYEDSSGKRTKKHMPRPYTLAGLALHLNCDQKTIHNYRQRDKYFPILAEAKLKVEEHLLTQGLLGEYNSTVLKMIMSAKFGYKEKGDAEVMLELFLKHGVTDMEGLVKKISGI